MGRPRTHTGNKEELKPVIYKIVRLIHIVVSEVKDSVASECRRRIIPLVPTTHQTTNHS